MPHISNHSHLRAEHLRFALKSDGMAARRRMSGLSPWRFCPGVELGRRRTVPEHDPAEHDEPLLGGCPRQLGCEAGLKLPRNWLAKQSQIYKRDENLTTVLALSVMRCLRGRSRWKRYRAGPRADTGDGLWEETGMTQERDNCKA